MSDMQDLIHSNTKMAIEQGRKEERQRIIDLIRPMDCGNRVVEHECNHGLGNITAEDLIRLIVKSGK